MTCDGVVHDLFDVGVALVDLCVEQTRVDPVKTPDLLLDAQVLCLVIDARRAEDEAVETRHHVPLHEVKQPAGHVRRQVWTDKTDVKSGQTSGLDRQDGRQVWTDRTDVRSGQTERTSGLDKQDGRQVWTDRMDVKSGQTGRTSGLQGSNFVKKSTCPTDKWITKTTCPPQNPLVPPPKKA